MSKAFPPGHGGEQPEAGGPASTMKPSRSNPEASAREVDVPAADGGPDAHREGSLADVVGDTPSTEFGVVIGGTLDPRPMLVASNQIENSGRDRAERAGDAVPEAMSPQAVPGDQSKVDAAAPTGLSHPPRVTPSVPLGVTLGGSEPPPESRTPAPPGVVLGVTLGGEADEDRAEESSGELTREPVNSSTDPREPVAEAESVEWLSLAERRAWVNLTGIILRLPGLLDGQLGRDSHLSFFEYMVLASLSESPQQRLRMSQLAFLTSGSLSRLSHVAKRLEGEGLITRETDETDRRATNAVLTEAGLARVQEAAPGHVNVVRQLVFDHVTAEQVEQLGDIASTLLDVIDPDGQIRAPGVR